MPMINKITLILPYLMEKLIIIWKLSPVKSCSYQAVLSQRRNYEFNLAQVGICGVALMYMKDYEIAVHIQLI